MPPLPPRPLRVCKLSLYARAVASSGDRATRDGPDFRRIQGDAPNALSIRYVERLAVAPHTKRSVERCAGTDTILDRRDVWSTRELGHRMSVGLRQCRPSVGPPTIGCPPPHNKVWVPPQSNHSEFISL